MSPKSLQLPNGHRTSSDCIRHAKVYPARSASLASVCAAFYEDEGLVYEGLVDLNRLVGTEAVEPGLQTPSQVRFELVPLP